MNFLRLLSLIILLHTCTGVIAQKNEKELIEAAIKLKNEGKVDEALESCTKAIGMDPKNSWAYNVLGTIYYSKKDYDMALKAYSEAIRLSPKYTSAITNRALIYNLRKQYDLAIDAYSEAIKLERNSDHLNNRGRVYSLKKDYDLAMQDYTEAIKISPKEVKGYTNRAYLYKSKGLYDLAIRDASEAIRIDPSSTFAYYARGYFYQLTGKYDQAILDYSEAIRIDPKYYSAYLQRGVSYKLKGLYTAAIEEFIKCVELGPDAGLTYSNLISPLIRTYHFSKAKEYLERYKIANSSVFTRTLNGGAVHKYFYLALLENIPNGNYKNVLENMDSAMQKMNSSGNDISKEVDPENMEWYIDILALKGYALEKLNRNQEAIDAYNQALLIHPIQPEVREAVVAIGKKQDAIAKNR
jgi:tetratricopeptide (TPR) repeat protein